MASYQIIILAIDTALATMIAGGGAQSISVSGKSISFKSLKELQDLREFYQTLENRENKKSFIRGIPKI